MASRENAAAAAATYARTRPRRMSSSSSEHQFLAPINADDVDVFEFKVSPSEKEKADQKENKNRKKTIVRKMTVTKKKNALRTLSGDAVVPSNKVRGKKGRRLLPTDSELDDNGSEEIEEEEFTGVLSGTKKRGESSYAAPTGFMFKPMISAVDEDTDEDRGSPIGKRPRPSDEE